MKNRIIYLESVEKLGGMMLEFSNLVNAYASNDPGFVSLYVKWLVLAENYLQKLALPECSALSAIRVEVLGIVRENPEPHRGGRRANSRKEKRNRIARTIPNANSVLEQVIAPMRQRIQEARELSAQLITVAFQIGLLGEMGKGIENASYNFQLLFHKLSENESTRTGMVQLKLLVSQIDAMAMLDQAWGHAMSGVPKSTFQTTRSAPQ